MDERLALDRAAARQAVWDELRTIATEILANHDPVGLIAAGAPRDEYGDVAFEAVKRLVRGESLDMAIGTMFRDRYGLEPDSSRVTLAAAELAAAEIESTCEAGAATLRTAS